MLQSCITASALEELVGFPRYPKVNSHMLLTCSSLHFPVLVSSCHLVIFVNTLTRQQLAVCTSDLGEKPSPFLQLCGISVFLVLASNFNL